MTANASGVDIDAVHVLANPEPPTPQEALRAKALIRRHVSDHAEWDELFLMLGLYDPGSPHREPGPRIAPMLAHVPARATKGRRRKS